MRELHDVQPVPVQVAPDRGQMAEHVVEGEQVAQRVEHGDGQVDGAGQGEVPHVGLNHGERDPGRRRQVAGPGAHRRVEVERGGLQAAPGQVAGVLGRARGELENRPGRFAVLAGPAQQGVHLGRDVAVGAGGLVVLGLVVDTRHPTMMPDAIAFC